MKPIAPSVLAMVVGLSSPSLAQITAPTAAMTAPACDSAATSKTYNDAVGAYTGQNGAAKNLAQAKTLLDGMIAACGPSPAAFNGRVLRANIALDEKDYDAGMAVLTPVPRPGRGTLGVLSSFVMMSLLAGKNDVEGFARERGGLMSAIGRALTSSPIGGALEETFHAPTGETITAYKAELKQSSFQRHYEFLVESQTPLAPPKTISLSTDSLIEQLGLPGSKGVYFLDEYSCGGHATVRQIASPDAMPSYESVKALVLQRLAGGGVVSGMTPPASSTCAFQPYIAPGLEIAN